MNVSEKLTHTGFSTLPEKAPESKNGPKLVPKSMRRTFSLPNEAPAPPSPMLEHRAVRGVASKSLKAQISAENLLKKANQSSPRPSEVAKKVNEYKQKHSAPKMNIQMLLLNQGIKTSELLEITEKLKFGDVIKTITFLRPLDNQEIDAICQMFRRGVACDKLIVSVKDPQSCNTLLCLLESLKNHRNDHSNVIFYDGDDLISFMSGISRLELVIDVDNSSNIEDIQAKLDSAPLLLNEISLTVRGEKAEDMQPVMQLLTSLYISEVVFKSFKPAIIEDAFTLIQEKGYKYHFESLTFRDCQIQGPFAQGIYNCLMSMDKLKKLDFRMNQFESEKTKEILMNRVVFAAESKADRGFGPAIKVFFPEEHKAAKSRQRSYTHS